MFGFGKKKDQQGTEEQLHETMNFGGFGGLKKKSSPGTTESATRSGSVDNALLDEVEKYDEKAFIGAKALLTQFRKDTEAGHTHAPKDFFKSIVNNKNEYEPEVHVISAYLFHHWYEETIEKRCKNLANLLVATKRLKAFLDGRENTAVLKDFSAYLTVGMAVNMIGFLSKENPSKKEELQKALLSVAKQCEVSLKQENTPAQTEQTISSSSSTNGKPFENALKQNGLTVEQVIEHRDEEDALAFHKKDPNTFSQVANYFYEILLKSKDNLKQDKKFELDLDASIPLNMLKASSVFSKDTAASYITSTFDVAAFVLNRMAVKDLDGNKLLLLLKFTTGLSSAIENSCNKVLGIETKQQVQEKKIEPSNGEDKKDWKKLSESVQNNPNIPDDLKKGLKDITSFFSGETPIAEMQFNSMIEDFTNDQMKEKYLQVIGGNMLDTAVDSLGLQEYYPKVQETKQELKNADAYLDFYVMGVVACIFSEDKEIALKKFAEKMGGANFNDVAAMLLGIVSGAQVKIRKGETGNHALLFEFVKRYLPAKKNQTKSELAEGFKERGIDIPDSALEMFAQTSETLGVKRQAELAEEMEGWGNPSKAEQPKQEVKEAPKRSFFDDKPKKTEYKLHPNFAENAENLADIFKQVAEALVKEVREAVSTGNFVEDVFKHYCYNHVIRYHLQSAAFAQPALMESTLHYCQKINRPELHLVEMVTLAHWRPLLEIAYQELHAPILNGEVKSVEDQNKIVQSFQRIARNVVSGMKDNSEYLNMTDEEIIIDFLEVIPFYQVVFLAMPFTMARNELSPLVNETKDYLLRQSDEYNQTWVTTALMFAYDTALEMKKMGMGMGIGLDQYPNQGPNFALLMLFFFHQINQDMKIGDSNGVPVATGMEPRYPLSIIPEVERVKENMMIAMAGSHVFEELVPDLESSKATETKVEKEEQSEDGSGKLSPLARVLAETAKEIKDQLQWFQEVEIASTPFQVMKLAANSLYVQDKKDGFDLINGYEENHKNEEHWKNVGNTSYGKAMFYAGAAIAKVCFNGSEKSAIAVLPFFRDVADWIVSTKQENAEELMNFLNVPLSMIYGSSKNGSTEFKNAFGKLIEELKTKGQANDDNTDLSPTVRDLMGNLATLTQGLMGLEGIDDESKAELAKQLEELKNAGFTPGVIPEATNEESDFSPEKTKEIKSKMLPWFKNSGVLIDDDVLALSIIISQIKEAEKNGFTEPHEIAQKLLCAPVFKELYSTEFGQAVFYATYAIVITLEKEEFLADMIDGYINILNWIINQEERAKKAFYVIYLSALVEMAARKNKNEGELKERYDNLVQDFQKKALAWGMIEGVSAEIMEMK